MRKVKAVTWFCLCFVLLFALTASYTAVAQEKPIKIGLGTNNRSMGL